jgi:translation initiation factor IF-3
VRDKDEALWLARQLGLDLVEVSPGADPPVCRLMDYGKYKYEQSVKARESRKKQTRTVIKEVKFRTKIDGHDFDTKIRKAAEFLREGHKVKAIVMFFGREITHPELGRALLARMIAKLEGTGLVETEPRLEGNNMNMLFAPDKAGIAAAAAEEEGDEGNEPEAVPEPATVSGAAEEINAETEDA